MTEKDEKEVFNSLARISGHRNSPRISPFLMAFGGIFHSDKKEKKPIKTIRTGDRNKKCPGCGHKNKKCTCGLYKV